MGMSGREARFAMSRTGLTWSRFWPASLGFLALAFIAYAVPPYLTFDPERSRIPPPSDLPVYYPLLVAHVVFATIAMSAGCVQIWTGIRGRYPKAHRLVGRVYVFAGVLPASLMGLAIGSVSPFGPFLRVSNVLLAILWLVATLIGFRKAQQQRFTEHRRWMVRSFVLTFSIITNRLWAVVFGITLGPQLATTFGGNEQVLIQTIAGLTGWMGWVLPLLLTEWWLMERLAGRQSGAQIVSGLTSAQRRLKIL